MSSMRPTIKSCNIYLDKSGEKFIKSMRFFAGCRMRVLDGFVILKKSGDSSPAT